MGKQFTCEYVKQCFSDRGYELLETEYVNSHTKLMYRCSEGHVASINFNNFSNGKGCRKCATLRNADKKRIPYKDVERFFYENGCSLLSTEYMDCKQRLDYVCRCGRQSRSSFSDFRSSRRCNECTNNFLSEKFRLDFDFVKTFFEEEGCILLEDRYVNARTKMKYECSCGNTSEIVFDSFRKGNRCRKCGSKKNSELQRLDHDYVDEYFLQHGCKLLEKYQKNSIPLNYICHCGRIGTTTFNMFQSRKRCAQCGLEARSGENHRCWIHDREKAEQDRLFRNRCISLVKNTLNAMGCAKNDRTKLLLGYDHHSLKDRIYNHENWETVKDQKWHIDHIFPIKAFIDYGIRDVMLVNSLDNLRPLLAVENLLKNAKYDRMEFENWLKSKGVVLNAS